MKQFNIITPVIFLVILLIQATTCKQQNNTLQDVLSWKLGWRMIENGWDEDYHTASLQFDTLYDTNPLMARQSSFLFTGVIAKLAVGDEKFIEKLLAELNSEELGSVCSIPGAGKFRVCDSVEKISVQDTVLQNQLMEVYVHDQLVRGNIVVDAIENFKVDTAGVRALGASAVDQKNRFAIDSILATSGFPTKKVVGTKAMKAMFLVVQHADKDKSWQLAMLPLVKQAVDEGDLHKSDYAYLLDRVRVNSGEPQLYGTQFQDVNFEAQTVVLAATVDTANMDIRRMEMELMPIELYKRLMLQR